MGPDARGRRRLRKLPCRSHPNLLREQPRESDACLFSWRATQPVRGGLPPLQRHAPPCAARLRGILTLAELIACPAVVDVGHEVEAGRDEFFPAARETCEDGAARLTSGALALASPADLCWRTGGIAVTAVVMRVHEIGADLGVRGRRDLVAGRAADGAQAATTLTTCRVGGALALTRATVRDISEGVDAGTPTEHGSCGFALAA